ncbi:MAG: hypothetical protein AMXMBFR84_46000 [Candidatus Hydrogenedentota bacterium]
MMRILIAQMTRMGDVIQTSPMIRALREKHPDAYIAIMVRRMGKAVAEANPDINEVLVYDEDTMFQHLRSRDSNKLMLAYNLADGYVNELKARRFDIVYNCTHSLSSAILFRLAGIPNVVGADLSDDWRYILRGPGANYFFTSVVHRNYNDVNLCDLFRLFVDAPPPPDGLVLQVRQDDESAVKKLLAEHGIEEEDPFVCFQLGASDNDKRWPEERFARLAVSMSADRGVRIVLVGVKEESRLGERFEVHAPNIAVHFFGKTSVPQLAALLKRSRMLITNDTGTMHVAAAVKCPIVLASVGYVHFRETGPYASDCCAIEQRRGRLVHSSDARQDTASREAILPHHVLKAYDFILEARTTGQRPLLDDAQEFEGVDFYWSRFAPDACLQWYPVIRREMTEGDYLRAVYRAMWLQIFTHSNSGEREAAAAMRNCYRNPDSRQLGEWATRFESPASELAEWAELGNQRTRQLIGILESRKNLAEARGIVSQLITLDERIRLQGELHDCVRPLTAIFQFERDNLEGADPLRVAKDTLVMYANLEQRARLAIEKCRLLE